MKEKKLDEIFELILRANVVFKIGKITELEYEIAIKSFVKEYADWKIKECLGEKEQEITEEVFEGKPVIVRNNTAIIRNEFRDQILANKDKIK